MGEQEIVVDYFNRLHILVNNMHNCDENMEDSRKSVVSRLPMI